MLLLAKVAFGVTTSAAMQGVNIAAGNQDKFSWSQIGINAIGAGVTVGIDASGALNGLMTEHIVNGVTQYTPTLASTVVRATSGYPVEWLKQRG